MQKQVNERQRQRGELLPERSRTPGECRGEWAETFKASHLGVESVPNKAVPRLFLLRMSSLY